MTNPTPQADWAEAKKVIEGVSDKDPWPESLYAAIDAALRAAEERGLERAAASLIDARHESTMDPDLHEYGVKKSASEIIRHSHGVGWLDACVKGAARIRSLKSTGGGNGA